MTKFYILNKQHIINFLIIAAIIVSAAATDKSFVRDAILGVAAGAAVMNFLSVFNRTNRNNIENELIEK